MPVPSFDPDGAELSGPEAQGGPSLAAVATLRSSGATSLRSTSEAAPETAVSRAPGFRTLEWANGELFIIDQTLLPTEYHVISLRTVEAVAEAIRRMRIRGAPAIGCAGAYGLAVCAFGSQAADVATLSHELEQAASVLIATRPTAVNLSRSIRRILDRVHSAKAASVEQLREVVLAEAHRIYEEDDLACRAMGVVGLALIPERASILTHCNAGGLATSGYGTVGGVIRTAHEAGRGIHVFVDETRPLLQGARLTAWELSVLGIPGTLVADNMAAHLMASGRVDLVLVGADRIARNGDTANKIGTLGLAVLAHHYGIPLYVVAPLSSFDPEAECGKQIPIEVRNEEELTHCGGVQIAPSPGETFRVYNPAFDVTEGRLVSAFVTELGLVRPPYEQTIPEFLACAPTEPMTNDR